MNLIKDPWLTYRFADGTQKKLPISAICHPHIVDFVLPRADFYGAAYQFAIGLLQTTFAPATAEDWLDLYEQPPTQERLNEALYKALHAFNLTGDGPLFMQDYDELLDAGTAPVASLLIEAPGANGIKKNTDLFVKRGLADEMSLEIAALALFTLQINAPAGGSGNRVGLRGGGPMTTLVLPQNTQSSLWHKLWLNVMSKEFTHHPEVDLNSASIFPWLAPTQTSKAKGSEIYSHEVHPLHMYWAMPRRFRLELVKGTGVCALTGEGVSDHVKQIRTQNYGNNYAGTWSHPLTPYRWNPKKPDEEHLSVKGQPGGITYKIWDVLTLSDDSEGQRCAAVVEHFYMLTSNFADELPMTFRLWAFAFDMDNMKARGWYSTTTPLFQVSPTNQSRLLRRVKELQQLAANALWHCRSQIKAAWFDKPSDVKGDTSFIDLAYWQRSEAKFYKAVQQLIANSLNGQSELSPAQADEWLKGLRFTSKNLFDEHVLTELGTARSVAKRIKARQSLTRWLFTGKEIKQFSTAHNLNQNKDTA